MIHSGSFGKDGKWPLLAHLEQDGILDEEFGQVAVSEGANEHDFLGFVGVLAFQGARHHEDRLEGPHAKVVVVLFRELFTAQLVHLRHLESQRLGGLEALGVEDDLGNQL